MQIQAVPVASEPHPLVDPSYLEYRWCRRKTIFLVVVESARMGASLMCSWISRAQGQHNMKDFLSVKCRVGGFNKHGMRPWNNASNWVTSSSCPNRKAYGGPNPKACHRAAWLNYQCLMETYLGVPDLTTACYFLGKDVCCTWLIVCVLVWIVFAPIKFPPVASHTRLFAFSIWICGGMTTTITSCCKSTCLDTWMR